MLSGDGERGGRRRVPPHLQDGSEPQAQQSRQRGGGACQAGRTRPGEPGRSNGPGRHRVPHSAAAQPPVPAAEDAALHQEGRAEQNRNHRGK